MRLLIGDCLDLLQTLDANSVHCCVTSPPYYNLRNYQVAGQIGLETTPEAYVAKIVEVFREVRRVLRPDGTVFLNLGDAYSAGGRGGGGGIPGPQNRNKGSHLPAFRCAVPAKNLLGMPWRCAFALQADGWILRSAIIWHKPNPMPESCLDRPTNSYEHVFLLAKKPSYYYDQEAIAEPTTDDPRKGTGRHAYAGKYQRDTNPEGVEGFCSIGATRNARNVWAITPMPESDYEHVFLLAKNPSYYYDQEAIREKPTGRTGRMRFGHTLDRRDADRSYIRDGLKGANARNVWTISPKPFKGGHFATMPVELAERCILAGTSAKGCCARCGAPWVREKTAASGGSIGHSWRDPEADIAVQGHQKPSGQSEWDDYQPPVTIGWRPSCQCDAEVVPCVVLDPFGGVGTTAVAAIKHGRDAVLIELNPDYVELANKRLTIVV